MPVIDRETQQRIKDAANIVEVVGDYVKLTRRGANYMGLCPFHNERTPSFSVSPRRNFCHCFSCKKGGSPVNFIMEKEGVSYTEALLILAKKYNIPVQQRELSPEEKERMSEREAMLVASEWAMKQFHDNLYNTEEGRDIGLAYLYDRGITDEAIRKFKLGYSIDRGDALLSKARSEGFDLEVFRKIGLVGVSQSGHDYDKFRGRVMFPIRNSSGKPVAFGGRALKGESAKYINSPESLLYVKSNELYGIFEAKAEVIRQDQIFLMEGYLDVIGSWQGGIRNAVASSGTALTDSQIALMHRFTENVTLIYDGDSAGIKASLRGIDMLLSHKMHVRVLLLPEGEDPDSFARKHTPDEFKEYVARNQTDFIRFKLSVLLKDAQGDPQQMSRAVESVARSIAAIPDEIERIFYIKECARMVGLDEAAVSQKVAAIIKENFNRRSGSSGFPSSHTAPAPAQVHSGPSDSKPAPEHKSPADISPYFHQEQVLLKYCIRYGFMQIVPAEGEPPQFVIDHIAEELDADGLSFTVDAFRRIFDILLSRKPYFESLLSDFSEEVRCQLKAERESFQDTLRVAGGSMARIRSAEEKYDAEEAGRRVELFKQFAIDFSVNFLTNHEDDEVREISNSLVAERHVLSAIYRRDGNDAHLEEDRLSMLVPRALSELRVKILDHSYQKLQNEFRQAVDRQDTMAQSELFSRMEKIHYARKRIAENLGDRILSPR